MHASRQDNPTHTVTDSRRRPMKARLVLALCATLLATIGVVSANSASASEVPTRECVATGTTELSTGIGLPTAPKSNVGFKISGRCAGTGLPVSATGTLTTASCGRSSGSGTITVDGVSANFNIETGGGTFVLTGGVSGGGQVVADVRVANNSCTNGTARFFITTGAVNW